MTTILSFTVIILALILGGLIFYILKNKKNQEGIDPNSPEIIKLDSQINNLENTITVKDDYIEQLKKEGEQGRQKINQYTRYGTVILAFFQSWGIAAGIESQGLASDPGLFFRVSCVVTLVGGTMLLMWLGEQITQRVLEMVFR